MTIPSEVNRSGPYNGNGVTTAFEYQFKIYEPEHLRVILIDTDGSETVLNHQHDFIVTGVADDSGGNAVLNVAPVNGQKIVLLRGVPFTQDTDLENQGAYYAETVEVRMDLLTMQIQQLKEQTDRSILADYGQSGLKIANNLDEGDTLMMVGGLLGKGTNSGMIVNAAGYATQAYEARDAAQGHAQDAETSAVETASSAATAEQWSARAQDWAVKLDGVVDGTDHSAKYWATQAYLNGGVPIGTIIDVYGNGTTTPPGYLKIIPGLEITTAYPELRTWALANGWSVNGAGNPVFPATDDALFKRQWRARHFAMPGVRLGRYKQMRFRGTGISWRISIMEVLAAQQQTPAEVVLRLITKSKILSRMASTEIPEPQQKLDQPTSLSHGSSRPTAFLSIQPRLLLPNWSMTWLTHGAALQRLRTVRCGSK